MDSPPSLIEVLSQPPGPLVLLVLAFLFGLLWGSFFNVCIYRLPMGLSPTRPRRSFCYSCGTAIAWHDNIPLVSWLILGGRCRHCGSRISFRYFVVEAVTGLLFALVWWSVNGPALVLERGGFSFAVVWYWAIAGLLIIGAMTDIDHWIIPESVTKGGLWASLAVALLLPQIAPDTIIARSGPFPEIRKADRSDPVETFRALLGISSDRKAPREVWGRRPAEAGERAGQAPPSREGKGFLWWEPLANAVAGAVVGFGLLWSIAVVGRLVFRKEAMGGGDLHLFAFLGAAFGPFHAMIILFLSSMIGVALGVGAMLWSVARPPRRARPADLLASMTWEDEMALGGGRGGRPAGLSASASEGEVGSAERASQSEEKGTTSESGSVEGSDAVPGEASEGGLAEALEPGEPPASQGTGSGPLQEYLIYARKRPLPRALHHIPFGPSISLAALMLLIYHDPIRRWLGAYLLPVF